MFTTHPKDVPQVGLGHCEHGLDVRGNSISRGYHGLRVQHPDDVEEVGVADDGHWPTTASDPAENEHTQSLASVRRTGSKVG